MIELFQHADAPAWSRQVEKYPAAFEDSTRWNRNNTWDGTKGWTRTLPGSLWMPRNGVSADVEVRQRVLGDGADSYSRGYAGRILEIEGVMYYEDPAEAFAWERKIKNWAVRPFLKLSYRTGSFINLGPFRGLEWEAKPCSSRAWARVRISWQIDDPYWYELELTKLYYQGSGPTITLATGAGDEDEYQPCFPVIELNSRPQSGHIDNGDYTLTLGATLSQRTAGSQLSGPSLTIASPGVSVGSYIRIDAENGNLLRYTGGSGVPTNIISQFTGEFWPLYPGSNFLVYSGSYIYMTFMFRKRWT